MRPVSLDEFVGQDAVMGEGRILRRAIEADRIASLIIFGPPGTGKNTIANIIAGKTKAAFVEVNAVLSGVDDLRKVIALAKERLFTVGKKTILFIDEIHRFNKSQQDALLPDVENGTVILIGATTQNPYFYVNPALISRSLIVEIKSLSKEAVKTILKNAVKDAERGLGKYNIELSEEALEHIAEKSDGDARMALNALEIGVLTSTPGASGRILFDLAVAQESIQKKKVVYDKDGDEHYNTISAFIKSMRGSDPDAALYYLAKMLYAGEDPRFIARRVVICASEDVGNADPTAVILSNTALQVAEFVGMPEARIPLAQAVVYVATAPKSNASYLGIDKALEDVKNNVTFEIPDYLKSTGYKGAEALGHGKGYKYSHDYEGHVSGQEYIPEKRVYYEPTMMGYEARIKAFMDRVKKIKKQGNTLCNKNR
ncbi:MAG: replication-associated recombination protein A [Candidatus Firestonebacteria bacterium]|nr:replication-associated recombination protein A [Candidatus Firestonebacteria bacterium]